MTKIPTVEERVKEYKDTNYHTGEKPNQNAEWVRQALTADRLAVLTELLDSGLLEEKVNYFRCIPLQAKCDGYNELARAIKAHINNLINPTSV